MLTESTPALFQVSFHEVGADALILQPLLVLIFGVSGLLQNPSVSPIPSGPVCRLLQSSSPHAAAGRLCFCIIRSLVQVLSYSSLPSARQLLSLFTGPFCPVYSGLYAKASSRRQSIKTLFTNVRALCFLHMSADNLILLTSWCASVFPKNFKPAARLALVRSLPSHVWSDIQHGHDQADCSRYCWSGTDKHSSLLKLSSRSPRFVRQLRLLATACVEKRLVFQNHEATDSKGIGPRNSWKPDPELLRAPASSSFALAAKTRTYSRNTDSP